MSKMFWDDYCHVIICSTCECELHNTSVYKQQVNDLQVSSKLRENLKKRSNNSKFLNKHEFLNVFSIKITKDFFFVM